MTVSKIKHWFPLVLAITLVVLLVICSSACTVSGSSDKNVSENGLIGGFFTQDGSCWFPIQNDEGYVHIDGDIASAYVSLDRKTIVVLETGGLLYQATVKDPQAKTIISESADMILELKATSVFYDDYSTGSSINCRYDFESGETIEMGAGSVAVAQNTASALICDDDGAVWMLPSGASTPEKVGEYDGTIQANCISNEGTLGVWTVTLDDQQTVYLCDSGEREKLATVDNSFTSTYTYFSGDNNTIVVINPGSDTVFLKQPGKDTVDVQMPEDAGYMDPFTENDYLSNEAKIGPDTAIYVDMPDESNYYVSSLYCINFSGERSRVLSGIRDMVVKDGYIYYIDESFDLRCAALDGDRISDERMISGNACTITPSPTGEGVCYSKNIGDDSIGSLYYYSLKTDESARITADAPFLYMPWSDDNFLVIDYSAFSTDGKYIYYLDEGAPIDGTTRSYGTLCRYQIRDGSVEKLVSSALSYFSSGRDDGTIDPDLFWGREFLSYKDDSIASDLFVFENGEKITVTEGLAG